MDVKRIAVIGAGQMGSGIAQVAAQSGYHVVLHDVEQAFVDRGMGRIKDSLGKFVQKGTLPQAEHDAILKRVTATTKLEDCYKVDLVIEAIIEKLEAKKDLFSKLDKHCPPATILASNTSSIPITEMAAVTKRPAQFIGMHFMNPVPIMKLVEIINGLETSRATTQVIHDVAKKMGKTSIEAKDFPGFAVNRILLPLINEAFFALGEGLASAQDIDTGAKLGLNHPMGPLELADFVGLDTCLYILDVMYDSFRDPKFRPAPLLRQYVQAGRYGRKTGKGVYEYPAKK